MKFANVSGMLFSAVIYIAIIALIVWIFKEGVDNMNEGNNDKGTWLVILAAVLGSFFIVPVVMGGLFYILGALK